MFSKSQQTDKGDDIITVEYPFISEGTLQIMNGLGESVKEMKFMSGSQKINTSDLLEGIYFIKLETKTYMLVERSVLFIEKQYCSFASD
jgi:hypothetical protein